MRIAILIPARGQMEVATAFDLVAMCAYTIKTTNHDIDLFTSSGTLIFDQRNNLVKTALEIKADYLLFVDADMRFPKDTLQILMAHDKDIIGVNATTRSEPVKPTAKPISRLEPPSQSTLRPRVVSKKSHAKVGQSAGQAQPLLLN